MCSPHSPNFPGGEFFRPGPAPGHELAEHRTTTTTKLVRSPHREAPIAGSAATHVENQLESVYAPALASINLPARKSFPT